MQVYPTTTFFHSNNNVMPKLRISCIRALRSLSTRHNGAIEVVIKLCEEEKYSRTILKIFGMMQGTYVVAEMVAESRSGSRWHTMFNR